jgi:DNA ligase D-like protein (predicted ligase)
MHHKLLCSRVKYYNYRIVNMERNVERLFKELPENLRSRIKQISQPMWVDPMLATLTEERFSDPDWIFEKKLDGVRAIAYRKGNNLQLLSRNKLSFNGSFPQVVTHLMRQPSNNFILDGEIVALEKGVSSFAKLQQRGSRMTAVYYYVFDLLFLDGYDLRELPLIERKKILRRAFSYDERLRYTTHKVGEGEAYFDEACRKNWEGIIAKRSNSIYESGRSKDWLKFKCSHQQEFVIVGYTDPQGSRTGFGALLVGYYSDRRLMYAGKVGTGYTTQTLQMLHRKLSSLERPTSNVKCTGLPRKNVHWVEPRLVAQIAFSEWTQEGKLRHPRFLGLRDDKNPREVVREN